MPRGVLIVCLSLIFFVPAHGAIVVFRAANREPIYGRIILRDNAKTAIRTVDARGVVLERVIPATEIAEVIETVNSDRLTKLNPSRPREYVEYAEELAEKARDLEARETAIRLYLTAARIDPKNCGRSSLLGLIPLARSSNEERAFRAAAYAAGYLNDPERLRPVAGKAIDAADQAGANDLLRAVRAIRRGKGTEARTILEDSAGATAVLERYRRIAVREELVAACSAVTLKPEILAKCLLLELALETGTTEAIPQGTGKSWSDDLLGEGAASIPCLRLECLTEFDPQASLYREGKWIVPSR